MEKINSLLIALGLSIIESQVYISCLKMGLSPASSIARQINIDRSNCYKVLDSLIQKGFIVITLKSNVKFYKAISPERLENKIKDLASIYEEVLPELLNLKSPLDYQSDIILFEGKENIKSMIYENIDLRINSLQEYDKIRWGYQDHNIIEVFFKELEYCWEKQSNEEYIKILSNTSEIEKTLSGKIKNREVKIITGLEFHYNTIWICGEYVISINMIDGFLQAYQIKNKFLANNMKNLIKYIRERGV